MRRKFFLSILTTIFLFFSASPALAAGGAGQRPIQEVLLLLGIVAIAYLVSHLLVNQVAKRFGFISGVEFILLGAIIGPGLGLLNPEIVERFRLAIFLATGSLGLLVGLEIDFKQIVKNLALLKTAILISITTLLIVVGLPTLLIYQLELNIPLWMPIILCAGANSLVIDATGLDTMSSFLKAKGTASELAIKITQLNSSLSIICFGLIFCFYNPGTSQTTSNFTFGHWLLIHLALGLIFSTFLRKDFKDEKLLTIVLGIVVFSSGLASYLRLSPIFVNFILGVTLINTCRNGNQVEMMLASLQRPFYIILFFFAGLSWVFIAPWWAYLLFIPFLLLRRLGHTLGVFLALHNSPLSSRLPGLERAMLSMGGLSIAMTLNFAAMYKTLALTPLIYSTLLISIILSEVFAPAKMRAWLIDAADIPTKRD